MSALNPEERDALQKVAAMLAKPAPGDARLHVCICHSATETEGTWRTTRRWVADDFVDIDLDLARRAILKIAATTGLQAEAIAAARNARIDTFLDGLFGPSVPKQYEGIP